MFDLMLFVFTMPVYFCLFTLSLIIIIIIMVIFKCYFSGEHIALSAHSPLSLAFSLLLCNKSYKCLSKLNVNRINKLISSIDEADI